jgi:hypothetical protein
MKHTFYWAVLILVSFKGQAQGLHLMPGVRVVVSGAPQIVMADAGLVNDGELVADSSTFLFTGSSLTIGGRQNTSFYNLIIGGDVNVFNSAAVTGNVFMQGGNLRLHRYTLDLGTSGRIIDERSASAISGGLIKARAYLDAPHEVNPGNMGLALSSEGAMGWTTIIRGNEQQTDAGILRYFSIDPEKSISVPVNYRLYYLEGELDGKSRNKLSLLTRDMGSWVARGKDQTDLTAGWVAKKYTGSTQVVTLGVSSGDGLRISPNPTSGPFKITCTSIQEGDRLISLYDMTGHLLKSRWVHCMAGVNTVEWDGAGYAAGAYRLVVGGEEPVTVVIMR